MHELLYEKKFEKRSVELTPIETAGELEMLTPDVTISPFSFMWGL